MRLETLPVRQPGIGEVLVRIRCATICGSDLHSISGRRPSPAPGLPGHEMVGEVAALGGEVRDFNGSPLAEGGSVTWSMVWSCGNCACCARDLRAHCHRVRKFGHESIDAGLFGGYAEYCHLPAGTAIFRVPANVSRSVAAPANCATATVAAVLRNAGRLAGAEVAIFGAGMLGLTACAMAAWEGARRIVAIEPVAARRELALRFGASQAVEPSHAAEAGEMDFVLEFAGTPESNESAVSLLRPGGHLPMAGAVFPSRPLALSAERIVRHMLRLTGVYNYSPRDLDFALRFLANTRHPFTELAGAEFPLEAINEALDHAGRERPPRVAIVFP